MKEPEKQSCIKKTMKTCRPLGSELTQKSGHLSETCLCVKTNVLRMDGRVGALRAETIKTYSNAHFKTEKYNF